MMVAEVNVTLDVKLERKIIEFQIVTHISKTKFVGVYNKKIVEWDGYMTAQFYHTAKSFAEALVTRAIKKSGANLAANEKFIIKNFKVKTNLSTTESPKQYVTDVKKLLVAFEAFQAAGTKISYSPE